MPTSAIRAFARPAASLGFTLLELVVALVIASLLAATAMPSLQRISESIRYREAVRDLVNAAKTAHRDALAEGYAVDLLVASEVPGWLVIRADRASDVVADESMLRPLPEELEYDITFAQEVSPGRGVAGIRFYPSGGASGGDIDVIRENGSGVRIKIDWLLADVTQVPVLL